MTVTVLGSGTSQGVPVIGCHCRVCASCDNRDKRLRSSVLVETDGLKIVIDAGPDFRYQMLREGVDDLNAILLTHNHKDHTGGIDDVRGFNYVLDRPMDIYAEGYVIDSLKKEYSYAFSEHKYPGVPDIAIHKIDETEFLIQNTKITPIRGMHFKLPVLGYRIGAFGYLTDMNFIEERELEKLNGIDTLIITALRREPHLSHFCLSESLEIIQRIAPQRAYLTHASHQLGLYEEVSKELPENTILAYDKLKLEIR